MKPILPDLGGGLAHVVDYAGDFREDLDLGFPASLFNDCPSVKALKDYLSGLVSGFDVDIPEPVGSMAENLQSESSPNIGQH